MDTAHRDRGQADAERAWDEHGPAAALAALRAVPAPDPAARRTVEAELLLDLGRREEAREAATLAVSAAHARGGDGLGAALAALGWALFMAGDPAAAAPLLQRARALAASAGQVEVEAIAAHRQVALKLAIGQPVDADAELRRWLDALPPGRARTRLGVTAARARRDRGLLASFESRGLGRWERARVTIGASAIALDSGDHEEALALARASLDLLDGLDDALVLEARHQLGEVLRHRGELTGAERSYRLALAGGAEDVRMRRTVELALGQALLAAERWAEAAEVLDSAMTAAARDRMPRFEGLAAALGAAAAAVAGDGATWARCTARADTVFHGALPATADACRALRFAGERWATSDDPLHLARAARAHSLALALWRDLGEAEQAASEASAIAALLERGARPPAGPFDLVERLGTGAMGEVWRARHHLRGTEVAVKLLRTGAAEAELVRLGIDAEVRSVAALDHPGIARLLGHGVLDAGELRGAPWFAMELVRGGTLHGSEGRLPWASCRGILAGLLDALAHAHARGVLHLDLKPVNILVDATGSDGPRPRLTDFGVAGILASLAGSRRTAGTPRYMAPEQFRGDLRELGPWTDLYALGCLAMHLVTGRPPYPGRDPSALRAAHLGAPIPPLTPRIPVPEGFADWVRRLLAKDPRERFRRAADAAWALSKLRDPPDTGAPHPRDIETPVPESAPATFALPSWDELDASEIVVPATPRPNEALPPMPTRWRGARPRRPAGLQALDLFGLRRVPFVGRDQERSLLWATLADVHRNGRPRIVTLEGPPGSGRSALARWLQETADERGVAQVYAAECPETGGGLPALVRQLLRCEGLAEDAVPPRVTLAAPEGVEPETRAILARLVSRPEVEPEPFPAACARLLQALGEERPVLVVLEEAPMADAQVAEMLRVVASGAGRVMCVVEVSPREQERGAVRRYDDLLDLAPVMPLQLEAPSREAVVAVLLELLPLQPDLVAQLVTRSAGNLHFAVALVESLVERDALVAGSGGLRRRDGASLDLPTPLESTWTDRLERALADAEPALRDALCTCALAGDAVGQDCWKAVCDALGVASPSNAVRRLKLAKVIAPRAERGWGFAHPALVEILRGQAAAGGRLPELSALAVARIRFDDPGRLGRLKLDAGDLEGALAPLLAGVRAASAAGDARAAEDLLDRRDEALRALGIPETDPRWRPGLELRVQLAIEQSDVDPARRWVQRLVETSRDAEAPAVRALALRLRAQVEELEGDLATAVDSLHDSLDAAREAGDRIQGAQARKLLGDAARRRGDLEGAMRHYRRGLQTLAASDLRDEGLRASLEVGVGTVFLYTGHLGPATCSLTGALDVLREMGEWSEAARSAAALGSLACRRQQHTEAERWFELALRLTPPSHRVRRVWTRLDRCLAHVTAADWSSLEREARSVLGTVENVPVLRAWARALLLPIAVVAPLATWEEHLSILEADLRRAVLCTPDVALVAEAAATRAEALGRPDRARSCWRLAATQWRTLGARAEAERARARSRA